MPRPALLEARAHAFDRDREATVAQPLLELAILPGGPDGQYTLSLQRRVRGRDPGIGVEARVVRGRERVGTVIHVEKDRVESLAGAAEGQRDIARLDLNAAILEW